MHALKQNIHSVVHQVEITVISSVMLSWFQLIQLIAILRNLFFSCPSLYETYQDI